MRRKLWIGRRRLILRLWLPLLLGDQESSLRIGSTEPEAVAYITKLHVLWGVLDLWIIEEFNRLRNRHPQRRSLVPDWYY